MIQLIVNKRVQKLEQEIDNLKLDMNKPKLNHLKNYVQGLITSPNKTIQGITNHLTNSPDQSNLNRALKNMNKQKINQKRLQKLSTNKKQGTLELDDTTIEKTGKHMQGANYHYDHSQGTTVYSHKLVTSCYKDKQGTTWPLLTKPYLKKEIAKQLNKTFKTKIEIAKQLIKQITSTINPKYLVMDTWYFSQDLVELAEEKELTWVTQSKYNRKIHHKKEEIRVDKLPERLPEKDFKKIDVEVEDTKYTKLKELEPNMKNLGPVKLLVLGKKNGEYEYLVSNDLELDGLEVLRVWKDRWSIETVHRDCKQELGLGAYQTRDMNGIVIHLSLVFLAYALLKTLATETRSLSSVTSTIGEICRLLKSYSLENFVEYCIGLYKKVGKIGEVREIIRSRYPI